MATEHGRDYHWGQMGTSGVVCGFWACWEVDSSDGGLTLSTTGPSGPITCMVATRVEAFGPHPPDSFQIDLR